MGTNRKKAPTASSVTNIHAGAKGSGKEVAHWSTTRERTEYHGCVIDIWERGTKTATAWQWRTRGPVTISGFAPTPEQARTISQAAAHAIADLVINLLNGTSPGSGNAKPARPSQTELDLRAHASSSSAKRRRRTG